MPSTPTQFQVGDLVNVVANDEELNDICIEFEDAKRIREAGPLEVTHVVAAGSRRRIYLDTPVGSYYVLFEHAELAARPGPVVVSRRPPKRIRKAITTPLPLP